MKINGSTPNLRRRVSEFYGRFDALDTEGVVEMFSGDGIWRFGAASPLSGKRAIREALTRLFHSISSIHHETVLEWTEDCVAACECDVTYTRLDGARIVIPETGVLCCRFGLIVRVEIDYFPDPALERAVLRGFERNAGTAHRLSA